MDKNGIGLILAVIIGVVGLLGIIGAIGGIYYATDGSVEATVIDKSCPTFGSRSITIRTEFPIPGIEYTLTDVPLEQCGIIQKDNYVRYHINSERTSIWENEGGSCLYDTLHGVRGCDK